MRGSRRTRIAILLMIGCMLANSIIGLGSLTSTGGVLKTEILGATSTPTILVTILDPVSIALEFAAAIIIFAESRKMEGLHKRLASLSLFLLITWLILNLGVFLPISLIGLSSGSIDIVRTGLVVKSVAAILQYIIPLTLIYGVAGKVERKLLISAAALTIIGNFLMISLPIWSVKLVPITVFGGGEMYKPVIEVNYLTQPYLTLLIIGYLGGILYLIAYALTYASFG